MPREVAAFRLPEETLALIDQLALETGLRRADIVMLAVREYAANHGKGGK
jgi:hypothetical protein